MIIQLEIKTFVTRTVFIRQRRKVMKAILALLLCFSLTAAKYLVKRKLEDPPNPPNPAKIMFDVEVSKLL